MKRRKILLGAAALATAVLAVCLIGRRSRPLVLTGIVTTDEVTVGSEIQGRLQELDVREGDTVRRGQLLGRIQPEEQSSDLDFYRNGEREAEADLAYQKVVTDEGLRQAEAQQASAQAQLREAEADLENDQLDFQREKELRAGRVNTVQDFDRARTAYDGAKARTESLCQQVQAAGAAVALAQAGTQQVARRQAALEAARAESAKAETELGYTEIRAPIAGTVDVRAALPGEVVSQGQAVLTLIDPDNLWVRADVEETYIDRVRLGDRLTVRFPSGAERAGTVFYRGADAGYATQRDVSRTKRDIRTFEIRLRCDNADRRLAVGMTAYVLLPLR